MIDSLSRGFELLPLAGAVVMLFTFMTTCNEDTHNAIKNFFRRLGLDIDMRDLPTQHEHNQMLTDALVEIASKGEHLELAYPYGIVLLYDDDGNVVGATPQEPEA